MWGRAAAFRRRRRATRARSRYPQRGKRGADDASDDLLATVATALRAARPPSSESSGPTLTRCGAVPNVQTVLRRQRSSSCRVERVVFRTTFKRGNNPSGEARQPLFTAPQPRNEQTDVPEPPRAPEPEAKREVQQYQRDTHASTGDLNASLGKGSEFEGKLAFEGKVRIDGTFTGEISTNDTLHIGEGAKVSAEISCGTVIVEGDVVGNIKATGAVELHRPAKVRGDITSPSLSIEKGVVFEGRSKMESIESSNVVNLRAASDSD
ncbi:MAG: polymer-forming cytoskeletal protein [Chloroflexi bacterium]|nr:MAG: polymer-forming cytoskeletal protein [Chloroflexota bacterium]